MCCYLFVEFSDNAGAKNIRSPFSLSKKVSPVKKLRSSIPESTVLHVGFLTRNVSEAHVKEIFGNYEEIVMWSWRWIAL